VSDSLLVLSLELRTVTAEVLASFACCNPGERASYVCYFLVHRKHLYDHSLSKIACCLVCWSVFVTVVSWVLLLSVLEVGDGVFEVLSTSGDTHLGGDDFDKV
jgi:Trk-type K+ transport system membrane component